MGVTAARMAELGTWVGQFGYAHHAASWAAICPGNRESAGKRLPCRTRKGNRWLRIASSEAA